VTIIAHRLQRNQRRSSECRCVPYSHPTHSAALRPAEQMSRGLPSDDGDIQRYPVGAAAGAEGSPASCGGAHLFSGSVLTSSAPTPTMPAMPAAAIAGEESATCATSIAASAGDEASSDAATAAPALDTLFIAAGLACARAAHGLFATGARREQRVAREDIWDNGTVTSRGQLRAVGESS
jgi:hypothetical protein